MNDILTVYASGSSIRQTAAATKTSPKIVQRLAREAGILRTKSEGKYLQYNPVTTRGGELVLKLSWVTIRSPYVIREWHSGEIR